MDDKCYALTGKNRCKILTVIKCPEISCSFFKTIQQALESCEEANARLASLDQTSQRSIADKYYHGKMPWLEGGADCGS
ncbi:MAG: hypothetical protein U9N81_00085 [Bacillota bacterium]|nr:hypothetical protein [Bacillota bacterium]